MTIETKFNVGENVFFLSSKGVESELIKSILIRIYPEGTNANKMNETQSNEYMLSNGCSMAYKEDKLFPTKESLLQSL